MPLLGYLLGTQFKDYITSIDHWIAFGLLSLIGINMIKESKNTCEITDDSGNRSDFCIFAGKYYSGSYDDRDNYIHFFISGCKDWQFIWSKVSVKS